MWFDSATAGIGIICGAVSGNIECIDIDEKHNIDPTPLLDQFTELVDAQASGLIARLVHETSINGGHHLVYRCSTIEGSKKLTRRPSTESETKQSNSTSQTLIETRGEGGYFACYPTSGYRLISGSLTAIPEITPAEREILWACARSMNQMVEEKATVTGFSSTRKASISRPGDDFNKRGDIRAILEECKWVLVRKGADGVEYWRRPGKTDGISATFNKIKNMFYVFSSSCDPLQPETWYTKFALLGLLKYGGDFTAAAKDLAEKGYGETTMASAESYLTHRYHFRCNTVTGRIEYAENGKGTFSVLEDYDLNGMYRELQCAHILIGRDALANLLNSAFSTPYDPFVEYYESLPKWDEVTDYIELLARSVTLKDPTQHGTFLDYLKKWLVAAVGCAVSPEVVNHTCLTLVGPQGRYKTTWLNSLVPSRLSKYIHVGTIDPRDKDTLIHLSECFLINLDELETLNKSELGTLKAIMTYKSSRIRRPYGRFAEELIRRASFVGSINRDSFLTDETGTRRFLVVEIDSIDTKHGINMDLVHAQAYQMFKSGYRYWFDSAETVLVNDRNKEFAIQTTEDELVAEYCTAGSDWLTATKVAERISELSKYGLGKSSARDFGYALSKAGYKKKKVGGVTYYGVEVRQSTLSLSKWGEYSHLGGVKGGVKNIESEVE
jgi:hypothetical protein